MNQVKKMTKKKSNFSKDFYSDLDKKRRGGCCTLWSIAIFLIIVFALIVVGVWFLKNKVIDDFSYVKKSTSEISSSSGVVGKLEEESKDTELGESITVSFSEDDLAAFFGIYNDEFPLKNANLNSKPEGIEIIGKTKNTVISLPVTVLLVPYIEEAQFQIRVESISSGVISLPKSARDAISNYMNDIIAKKSFTVSHLELVGVSTREDYLDIIGTKI